MPERPPVGDRAPSSRPAGGLADVVPIAALALWVLNDRALKAAWPGPVTGKLSDVAGLVVVPLALQAAWEVVAWLGGRWSSPSTRVLAIAIGVVGIGFAAAQVWSPASAAYAWGLGLAQWPFRVLAAIATGVPPPGLAPVVAVADAEDLLALPALAVTWWAGRRRFRA
jgi:hypothetical protein